MRSEDSPAELSSSHKLHLLTSAQHADKLLEDVEAVLSAEQSKSPFRRFHGALSPTQVKVVGDYLARIRAQMVGVLDAQRIQPPEPQIDSVHAIRVTLAFVRIAFQECTADRMRGYGEVPGSKVPELNGLVDEMINAIDKLDAYLAQGLGQDLQTRLARLEQAGGDIGVVAALERIIHDHGLVEFRSTLSMILDRLEGTSLEIALFGRVSSGKSSLLNHVVESDILPVGVNPITSVPTRLAYGLTPRLTIWLADKAPERASVEKLAEFVTEQHNPANFKHVTRVAVELPSRRLRDGVVLVDTPGLGSLATSGAAETLAYLPRCDLGVVLIDAGSTLTADDLSTIRALYEAGVPASVLLSKSDLLADEDRARSLEYISRQIHSQLGVMPSVHPVSVQPAHAKLLEDWLSEVILPLYDRHQQLRQDSLRRKIAALRESVETVLRVRLERAGASTASYQADPNEVDALLRKAAGRIAEVREACMKTTDDVRSAGEGPLGMAAASLADHWLRQDSDSPAAVVTSALNRIAEEYAGLAFAKLADLAMELAQTLQTAGRALGFPDAAREEDLKSALKELPRLDLGALEIDVKPGLMLPVWKTVATRRIERALRKQIGDAVSNGYATFGSILNAWVRRALADLQLRFDAQADAYRAHLDRLKGGKGISDSEESAIRRDLESLTADMMPAT